MNEVQVQPMAAVQCVRINVSDDYEIHCAVCPPGKR